MRSENQSGHQWCVFLCDAAFHINHILGLQEISFSLRPGDSMAQIIAPDCLERYFTFIHEAQNKKSVFFHEIPVIDSENKPLLLDFSCICHNDLYLVAGTSREMDLCEELVQINHELTQTLRNRIKTEVPPADYMEQMSGLNNELINMKRELMKKNAAISRLLDQKEALNSQLQELIDTRDLLFSIIAHDLRSPLSSVINLMSLVSIDQGSYEDAMKAGLFRTVQQTTAKTMQFLEDLLQWYRYSQNNDLVQPLQMDAGELANEALSHFKEEADRKQVRLKVFGNDTSVYADRQMIAAALRNLVSNAIKYTESGGSITVEYRGDGQYCQFSVIDTGVGIPAHRLDSLFDIKANKSTPGVSGEQGAGFGLVLTRLMVEKNRGSLKAYSEPGQGTRICLTLPANQDAQT
ncbi:sensor histidine kinase [Anoxynatronum buryatiense]|uniref:histidine kinase n=1 Tax=Anoxynatronum buryatiense TaxID=489973 RepID=A0AA46AKF6_9CLOT|nr:HAMP domain-containing sensor histidine kinase [Anoxynatronum buryatiense]SMP69200.1 Histidine kinase-, DNA gyrase B-, and HSP90-like ATPase [Anoxynatronum buryatiense]